MSSPGLWECFPLCAFSGFADKGTASRSWRGDLDGGDEAGAFRGVIRSKGQIWLANAHSQAMDWHSAGSVIPIIATHWDL